MTPAEFDTRRRLLGLTIEEAADWCGTSRRTVERWNRGVSHIAPSAIERIEELEDLMAAAVERAVTMARASPERPIPLLRYRSQAAVDSAPHAAGMPLGAHAILIGWIADALEDEGEAVEIVWGD